MIYQRIFASNPHSSAAALNALHTMATIVSGPYNEQNKTRIISGVMPSVVKILETTIPPNPHIVNRCINIITKIYIPDEEGQDVSKNDYIPDEGGLQTTKNLYAMYQQTTDNLYNFIKNFE